MYWQVEHDGSILRCNVYSLLNFCCKKTVIYICIALWSGTKPNCYLFLLLWIQLRYHTHNSCVSNLNCTAWLDYDFITNILKIRPKIVQVFLSGCACLWEHLKTYLLFDFFFPFWKYNYSYSLCIWGILLFLWKVEGRNKERNVFKTFGNSRFLASRYSLPKQLIFSLTILL